MDTLTSAPEQLRQQRSKYPVKELIERVQRGRFVLDCSLEAFLEGLQGDAQAAHGAGGLGFLAGETYGAYEKAGVNAAGCIPGYSTLKKGDVQVDVPWEGSGAVPLTDEDGQVVRCDVPLNSHTLSAEFWVVEEGTTPVLLIRQPQIFHVRYPDDPAEKLKQYMFFGRAVVEMCKRLRIDPSVIRINEAQLVPVIMAVDHHREQTRGQIGALLDSTRFVFTNHTQERAALPSWANRRWVEGVVGHDTIPRNAWSQLPQYHPMVQADERQGYLGPPAREGEGGVRYFDYIEPLNYGLHRAAAVNMVSAEHGTISREVVFPTQSPDQRLAPDIKAKLLTVTNGSDRQRWTSPALRTVQAGKTSPDDVTGEELLEARLQTKGELNDYLAKNGLPTIDDIGKRPLIALTRRHVEYKEIGSLIPLIRWMCGDTTQEYDVPGGRRNGLGANVLIGGVASDTVGRSWKDQFNELQGDPALRGRFVFAPRTGIEFMRLCTGSADFWIHGPRPTREACGTSYERAVFSGGWNICTATGGPMEHIRDDENGSIVNLFPDMSHDLVTRIFDGEHGEEVQKRLVARFQERWQQYLLGKLTELVARHALQGGAAQMAKDVYATSESMGIDRMANTYKLLFRAVMDNTLQDRLRDGTLKPAEPFEKHADVASLLS